MPDMFAKRPPRTTYSENLSEKGRQHILGQYPTPMWLAEAIVDRYFEKLDSSDFVLEPSCGPGRFLEALPAEVPAAGVEIDPLVAEYARGRTGREVISGDFRTVELNVKPTAIIGNPPFELKVIDRFLERSFDLLPEGGRLGFIVPAYMFQTAGRVAEYAETWSIQQEMIPRNVYEGLKLPLVFALFSKDHQRTLVGFAFYRRASEIQKLNEQCRDLLKEGRGPVWETLVRTVLERLGGEADLQSIYSQIEGRRPTRTQFWREKVRQVLQQSCVRVDRGRYALPETAAA